jgi:hypothetical protein
MIANHWWGLSDGAANSPCSFVALNERHDRALTKWSQANWPPTRALMALDGDLLPSRPASSLLSGEAHAA